MFRKCGHLTQPQDLEHYQRMTANQCCALPCNLSAKLKFATAERAVRSCNASLALNDGLRLSASCRAVTEADAAIEILGHEPGVQGNLALTIKAAAHYAAAVAMRFYTG